MPLPLHRFHYTGSNTGEQYTDEWEVNEFTPAGIIEAIEANSGTEDQFIADTAQCFLVRHGSAYAFCLATDDALGAPRGGFLMAGIIYTQFTSREQAEAMVR